MSKTIIVRNRRFHTTQQGTRNSTSIEPIAVALYTSLSATFPLGEAFFVRSVAYYSKDIPAELKTEVDAFIRQEALHSREHVSFNQIANAAGLPVEQSTQNARRQIDALERSEPLKRLAVTVALEHFTSVFAQVLLRDPRHLAYCEPQARALWQWHAVEEIEHKAVAMDVFNHVTARWSPLRRWAFRCGVMIETMARLGFVTWLGIANTLKVEGLNTSGWRLAVLCYLFIAPGILTAMSGQLFRYFMPGFHPNNSDESELLADARLILDRAVA